MSDIEEAWLILAGKCERCNSPGATEDTCPFSEEIHGDDATCLCCNRCRFECCRDI